MAHRIAFPNRGSVAYQPFDLGPCGSGAVRIQTSFSLLSTGTESIVLNGLYSESSHWAEIVEYPYYPGYATVGRVTEVADGVSGIRLGDMVFGQLPHASEHLVAPDEVVPFDGVQPEDAAWCALAGVAFVAAQRARLDPSRTVLIIGAGPVGQMLVRWAHARGSRRIIVVDPFRDRLEHAKFGGATHVAACGVDEAKERVLEMNSGELPATVIDATGRAATLGAALALVADFGRLVVAGDTGAPEDQHLAPDLLRRGLSIVGAHGSHLPLALGLRGPFAEAALVGSKEALYNAASARFADVFFNLVRSGRFDLSQLITHVFPARDAPDAYAMVNARRAETLGVLFDWTTP